MENPLVDHELEVTAAATEAALADGSATVIDIREPYEREAGCIPGTRWIELERLASQAESIDRHRPVIFYCRAGVRSLMAAQAFARAGFEARSMAGGLSGWHGEGRAMEPQDGTVADH